MAPQIHSCAPVFAVADPLAAARYYEGIFGFKISIQTSPSYAIVSRDGCEIHFMERPPGAPVSKGAIGGAFVSVDDPDAFYREVLARGASVIYPPTDQYYGQRDFTVHDPDGYWLCFGRKAAAPKVDIGK